MLKKWKSLSPLQQFAVKGALLFVLWHGLYSLHFEPKGTLDQPLTQWVTQGATTLFNAVGVEAHYVLEVKDDPNKGMLLYLGERPSVGVGNPCNGLEVMVLFIGFVLLAPGSWKRKWWFLLLGLSIIYLANAVRVMVLGITFLESPSSFDFHHKYTYKIAVYGVVVLLWMWWVEKLSGGSWKKETVSEEKRS